MSWFWDWILLLLYLLTTYHREKVSILNYNQLSIIQCCRGLSSKEVVLWPSGLSAEMFRDRTERPFKSTCIVNTKDTKENNCQWPCYFFWCSQYKWTLKGDLVLFLFFFELGHWLCNTESWIMWLKVLIIQLWMKNRQQKQNWSEMQKSIWGK